MIFSLGKRKLKLISNKEEIQKNIYKRVKYFNSNDFTSFKYICKIYILVDI